MNAAVKHLEDQEAMRAALVAEVARYKDNLPLTARRFYKIRTKAGEKIRPFIFNHSQRFAHAKLQAQLRDTGMVRAIFLKARQLGCSTYVAARYYHKVTNRQGTKAFILTHQDEATQNLFGMVERFHDNNNALLKPRLGISNAKEMKFTALESGYRVGTAGSVAVGRSDTVQLFHGSETSYWPNAESHEDGVLNTIADLPGTEIIFESTADGMLNYFHEQWSLAVARKTKFIPIFIPWFWGEDYRTEPPEDFELDAEENEYAETFSLDLAQMFWRRNKMAGKEAWRFGKEFPATPEEAFQSSGEGTYIKPNVVARARRLEVKPPTYMPIIIGIDPARGGRDNTAVIDRQGRRAGFHVFERWNETDSMVLVAKTVKLITRIKPKKVFIDATEGTGKSMCDRLHELGFHKIVEPVLFSSKAYDKDNFLNRRAEMWAAMKEWLDNLLGVQIPDDDQLQAQICAPIWGSAATRHNSSSQLIIELKEHIVKRLKRSPDDADALALTFSVPIIAHKPEVTNPNTGPADSLAGY